VETQEAPTLVRGKDNDAVTISDGSKPAKREDIFMKGQSKRIWGELYKVVDSSDVVIQVLDSRDPMGTRCRHLEVRPSLSLRLPRSLCTVRPCVPLRRVREGSSERRNHTPIRPGGGSTQRLYWGEAFSSHRST
jgi:hypothetical protein